MGWLDRLGCTLQAAGSGSAPHISRLILLWESVGQLGRAIMMVMAEIQEMESTTGTLNFCLNFIGQIESDTQAQCQRKYSRGEYTLPSVRP